MCGSLIMVVEKKNNVWFLDNGCTNHMTGNKNIFLDMDTTINSQVKMGNGDLVNVKRKDTIGIQTKVGTKHIRDVLLVLVLKKNLLSVGQLVEHGYKLHFEDNECIIYDKEKRRNLVKKIKMEKNKSIPIVFKYAENVALRNEDVEEAWLWHRRFGHLNFNRLKMLCQRKMVQRLPNTIEEKNEICEDCDLGKHHRQSFSKGVAWRAKKVLELIHTDICGPMSTPSHGNNKVKYHSDGRVQRRKARLVAKGYSQQSGIDFHETFAPVVHLDTIRTIIAMVAQKKNKVYKLKKALYGLKQALHAWYTQIDNYFIENGFIRSKSEPTLYVKSKGAKIFTKALPLEKLVHFRRLLGVEEHHIRGRMQHNVPMLCLVLSSSFSYLKNSVVERKTSNYLHCSSCYSFHCCSTRDNRSSRVSNPSPDLSPDIVKRIKFFCA
ncbi:Retrovirus-related Pol polyprotein from transposon TNT 1-94 [Vitis vinifera]|uniref:Retrovirus-related Pol polyprotein from transposon TNT 1-94 n=1 Tax=Vitis vinifera TaxID=29760 RepID=A0A438DYU7_VITVI|nr:Retrovirus-related Pol polyprotein from transposon TNT 1-94 [Vitis vinifera]